MVVIIKLLITDFIKPYFRNVEAVHARLMQQGKMSITFKSPPHMMMISDAKPEQLQILLQTLKSPQSFQDLDLGSAVINKVTKPKAEVKSMTITNLKQYPSLCGTGFPKTLTSLCISNLKYRHVDTRICSLDLLQTLDLSNNMIKKTPLVLWRMKSLATLNLSNNEIPEMPSEVPPSCEAFKSLRNIDISDNKLICVPDVIRYCTGLVSLSFAGNPVSFIPHFLKSCSTTLRHFDIERCNLKNLSSCFKHFSLNELKIHGNNFPKPLRSNQNEIYKMRSSTIKLPSLQEISVKCILRHTLPYSSLPPHLQHYINTAQHCNACLRLVMESALVYFYPVNLKTFSRSYTRLDRDVTMTGFICSQKCLKRVSEGKVIVPAKLFFSR